MYCLDAGGRQLVIINLISNEISYVSVPVKSNVFLRGLDIMHNKLVIGGSVNYKTSKTKNRWASLLSYDLNDGVFDYIFKDAINIRYINDIKIYE